MLDLSHQSVCITLTYVWCSQSAMGMKDYAQTFWVLWGLNPVSSRPQMLSVMY